MNNNIEDIRKNYCLKTLNEVDVENNPNTQIEKWWEEATLSKIDEVKSMTLSTASSNGLPLARIVLLKGFNEKGFIFFTNYESLKGKELAENPRACLLFFWKELERQVRIVGITEQLSAKENDDYFYSRPIASQIGACASPQSRVIENRLWLDNQFEELSKKQNETPIQRPSYWGGYIVKPVLVEFWQGRTSRLHDRLQYHLQDDGSWTLERLAP